MDEWRLHDVCSKEVVVPRPGPGHGGRVGLGRKRGQALDGIRVGFPVAHREG